MKHIMVFLNNVYRLEISLPSRQLALFEVCGFFFFKKRTHKYLTCRIKKGAGGGEGNVSLGTAIVPRVAGLALCRAAAWPWCEPSGRGGLCPMGDLEPGASEPPGARASEVSPDGRAAWHRCTSTCLLCFGRMTLRRFFSPCASGAKGPQSRGKGKMGSCQSCPNAMLTPRAGGKTWPKNKSHWPSHWPPFLSGGQPVRTY